MLSSKMRVCADGLGGAVFDKIVEDWMLQGNKQQAWIAPPLFRACY